MKKKTHTQEEKIPKERKKIHKERKKIFLKTIFYPYLLFSYQSEDRGMF